MGHSALDMLDKFGTIVKDVDGANAPWMVVTILPVKQAVFPVMSLAVPQNIRFLYHLPLGHVCFSQIVDLQSQHNMPNHQKDDEYHQ